MPTFNPTLLLENEHFSTPGGFTIRRYVTTTDNEGVTTRTMQEIHAEGVIVPSGSKGMTRTPEDERQAGSIEIYTRTPLSTGTADGSQAADEIVWHSQEFVLTNQDDYTDFGFNTGVAALKDAGGRSA